MKSGAGFTLVELLIVVAIIGVLSVVGLTAFSSVQQKARDTKRKADIDAYAKVMESGYNIKNATYPSLSTLAAGFAGNIVPSPPKNGDYAISTDNKSYIVCSKLDNASSTLSAQDCIANFKIGLDKISCYCRVAASGSIASILTAAAIGGDSAVSVMVPDSSGGSTSTFSAPSNLAVSDSFTRVDSAAGLGVTETGSKTWEYSGAANSWSISSNQAGHTNNGSNNVFAVVNGGYADSIVRVNFSRVVPDQGMVFRYADPNNTFRLAVNGDGYMLQKIAGGVTTTAGQVAIPNFDSTYRGTSSSITVVMQSNNIQVFIDSSKGNSWTMNYSDSDSSPLKNNTKAGLWVWADTTMSWDNFSVSAFQPVPTPTPSPTPTPIPTSVPDCTACAADINKDGVVNITDFSLWFSCFNRSTDSLCVNADINRDGSINQSDLTCLLSQFGKQCLNANTAN